MLQNTLVTSFALCAAVVAAADPVTTQILLAGFNQQSVVGSVITSDATATTFSIACAPGATCNIPADFIFTQGPSTVHYAYTHSAQSSDDFDGTIDVGCTITSDHGTCSKTVNAFLSTITSTATSSTTTFSGASEMGGQILTITAGQLVTPTTASLTSSATSFSSASKNATSSSTFHSSSTYSFSNSSSTSSSLSAITPPPVTTTSTFLATPSGASSAAGVSSSSVTGGMPAVTASAQWVIGGVAALVALAAL